MSEVNKETRWDLIIREIGDIVSADIFLEHTELTKEDLILVLSVLKDNVPFLDEENIK